MVLALDQFGLGSVWVGLEPVWVGLGPVWAVLVGLGLAFGLAMEYWFAEKFASYVYLFPALYQSIRMSIIARLYKIIFFLDVFMSSE